MITSQVGKQQASEHLSGAKQAGDADNKQCLVTRVLDGATGMARLKR